MLLVREGDFLLEDRTEAITITMMADILMDDHLVGDYS